MSNIDIAVSYALKSTVGGSVMISPEFFKPFKAKEARVLRKILVRKGLYVFPTDTEQGCVAVRKNSPYIQIFRKDGFCAGFHQKDNNVIMLGTANFPDLINAQ